MSPAKREGFDVEEAPPWDRSAPEGLRDLLEQVDSLFASYVAFPTPQARWAVTLWAMHTWALRAFESTPRLHFQSAEKQSGKTRGECPLEWWGLRAEVRHPVSARVV
jgi:hypothetical protein